MPGLIVPNANEYGASIQSLDQAEPDSLDFSILGNANYGVLTGCDITVSGASDGSATLTVGEVIINGAYGYLGIGALTFTAPSADPRFDIVVASVSAGVFSYATVLGTSDATNPVFPIIASTQVPLFALYRKSGVSLSATSVVDKRRFSKAVRTGTAVPTIAASTGDTYVRTGSSPASGQSTMYVYVGGLWKNLGEYVAPPDPELHQFLFSGL